MINLCKQFKCKLNNAVLFLILFHIQSKEIRSKKYYEENKENKELEKWLSDILLEYRF